MVFYSSGRKKKVINQCEWKKVTLPPTFGSAYVGETFACSLCANNELSVDDDSRVVSSVRMMAEMQTPSQVFPLELTSTDGVGGGSGGDSDGDGGGSGESQFGVVEKGQSLQKIIRFDLKEEGNHVLAVSLSYTETFMAQGRELSAGGGAQAAGGRVRTFRKLYQFIAQPCLSVRTKATELAPHEVDNRALGPYGKSRLLRYALEAQLENVGDGSIVLGVGNLFIVIYIYTLPSLSNRTLTKCTGHVIKPATAIQIAIVELGL